ncbi:oligosaccharide flippase family protein [Vibrio sp. ZSDE26]|uniref:Oligosaccharide flippase family protein n=1 Tax=Vibrio amylolyticus TaxID=2847292 RepID=A0A9X1XPN7_9VIBR|nr:oligosaccharide flippase family protein [Vibrio amylolyticus]
MKKLIRNIIYLSGVKGVDFIIPLLVLPFVLKHIGLEQYGIFSICLVFFNFGISLADFGHNLTAIKEISEKDKNGNAQAINQTLSFKLICSITIVTIAFIVSLSLENIPSTIVAIFSLALISESLSLAFYFQAKQEMKAISMVQLFSRILSTGLVFILVNNQSDLVLYSALHVMPNVINTVIIFFMFCRVKDQRQKFRFNINFGRIKKGWNIYSYQMLSGLILPMTSSFIASVFDIKAVALFSICQRIVSSMYRLFEPAVIAIFPYFSRLSKTDYYKFKFHSFIVMTSFFICSLFISVLLNSLGNEVQLYINGAVFSNNDNKLYFYMAFLLVPMVMNLITTRLLIVIEKEKLISKVLLISFILIFLSLCIVYMIELSLPYVSISLLVGYLFTMIVTINIYIRSLK